MAEEIAPGMDVVSCDGEEIGQIKEILSNGAYFRVDLPMAPDYYVPADAVMRVEQGKAVLRVTKTQAAYSGWELRPEQA